MSADRKEIASFKVLLNRASTSVIIKSLNDSVIARLWKRDMAEVELERRKSVGDARQATESLQAKQNHHSATLKGWFWALILLAAVGIGAVVLLIK